MNMPHQKVRTELPFDFTRSEQENHLFSKDKVRINIRMVIWNHKVKKKLNNIGHKTTSE